MRILLLVPEMYNEINKIIIIQKKKRLSNLSHFATANVIVSHVSEKKKVLISFFSVLSVRCVLACVYAYVLAPGSWINNNFFNFPEKPISKELSFFPPLSWTISAG